MRGIVDVWSFCMQAVDGPALLAANGMHIRGSGTLAKPRNRHFRQYLAVASIGQFTPATLTECSEFSKRKNA
jgi:hypothetical protein